MARKKPVEQPQAVIDAPVRPDEVMEPLTDPIRTRLAPDGQTRLELPSAQEPTMFDDDGEPIYEVDGGERLRRAVMLRLAGSTYDQIARTLNYASPEQARNSIQEAMKTVRTEALREVKRIHHMRLEHMLMLLWPGINSNDMPSMSMGLQVLDRIDRLHGLSYVPSEAEEARDDSVLVVGGAKEDFMQALESAKARRSGR